ncbi:unnamed protein product [Arctogadus glacialis]
MQGSNWIELGEHNYKRAIALTSDKRKALLYRTTDLTLSNILLYDNQGKLISKFCIKEIKEAIVLLDWLMLVESVFYIVKDAGDPVLI